MTPAPTPTPTPTPPPALAGHAPSGTPPAAPDQRSRILAVAFGLMSEHGSASTSMRRLAAACGVNVATIYHYFPSKADLLRAVIEQRRYGDRLAAEEPPVDPTLDPRARLATLLAWIWDQTKAEHEVLRLIVGEGTRGDETARQSARSLIAALDRWLADVLTAAFPELAERGVDLAAAARIVRRHLLGLVAEHLIVGQGDDGSAADELAAVLFP